MIEIAFMHLLVGAVIGLLIGFGIGMDYADSEFYKERKRLAEIRKGSK